MRHFARTFLLSSILSLPLAADVLVVREIKTDGIQGFGGSTKVTQTWISGAKQREQDVVDKKNTSFLAKMAINDQVQITRYDKKVLWVVDDKRKRYTEISLVSPESEAASESEPTSSDSEQPEKPTSRVSKAEFKVQAGGNKKTINGFPCQDFTITSLLEIEDLETREKSGMKMTTHLWTTPETGAVAKLQQAETGLAKARAQAYGMTDSPIDMKVMGGAMLAALLGSGEKELSKALSGMSAEMKKVKGYPIVTRTEWSGSDSAGMAMGGTQEVKSISVDPVAAAQFEIPTGYKKN